MTLYIQTPAELGAPEYTNQPGRILYCECCQTFTPHTLTKSQTYYVCACGEMIQYIIDTTPTLAIRR